MTVAQVPSTRHRRRIVERGPGTIAVQEAVRVAGAVYIRSDNLPSVVDGISGGVDAQGIVQCGPGTIAVQETIFMAGAVCVRPNHLA